MPSDLRAIGYDVCDDGEGERILPSAIVQRFTRMPPGQAQLQAENYRYTDVKPERLQRAIEADIEWLEAHPTRKSIAASRQGKKSD